MPIAKIQLPDGRIARFDVPDGTTGDQVMQYVQQNQGLFMKEEPSPDAPSADSAFIPGSGESGMESFIRGLGQGTRQTIGGATQTILDIVGADPEVRKRVAENLNKQQQEFQQETKGSTTAKVGEAVAETLPFLAVPAVGAGTALGRIGTAAATGALTGATRPETDIVDRESALLDRAKGAVGGGAIEGLRLSLKPIAAIGKSAVSSLGIKVPKASKIPNAQELRQKASQLYKEADEVGGVLSPKFTNKFLNDINKLKPQTDIGKIVGGASPFSKVIDDLQGIKDRPMSLQAAQELDEFLGDVVDSFSDTMTGKLTKQGKKVLDIQSNLRNNINNLPSDLVEGGMSGFNKIKQARKLWSTSRKLADVERIINRAELMDNPATGIRSGFRTLLNNPKRLKGFSDVEKKAIREAAETGTSGEILRAIGSRLPAIVSLGTGNIGGAAGASAAGMAGRNLAARQQIKKVDDLARLIVEGASSRPASTSGALGAITVGAQKGGASALASEIMKDPIR